jgi:hypothetical protein
MITVCGQADLLQIVVALDPVGRLAHLLHGRQEQADQDRDDRDHRQQFNERESAARRMFGDRDHG